MGYPRIKFLSKNFSHFFLIFFFIFKLCLNISHTWIIVFINLISISSSDVFTDKNHIAPRLSSVNVAGLNKLLRSEIFISEYKQLWAVHLILDYKPLSRIFQGAGQATRAGDPRLARINVSKSGFLAQGDLPPVELPI